MMKDKRAIVLKKPVLEDNDRDMERDRAEFAAHKEDP